MTFEIKQKCLATQVTLVHAIISVAASETLPHESLICNQLDNAAILEVKAKQFFL